MNSYCPVYRSYYVVLNEQLLIILCDEVVPVVNPEKKTQILLILLVCNLNGNW